MEFGTYKNKFFLDLVSSGGDFIWVDVGVTIWIDFFHHCVVEVLVGKEGGTHHHGQANCQHHAHETEK